MAIVLCARESVERENSISCDTQLEYCRSMLRPDEQDEKIVPIVDDGFSSGNVNRDSFHKLDRISRSLADFVNILREFKVHDVMSISSQESLGTSSPLWGDVQVVCEKYGHTMTSTEGKPNQKGAVKMYFNCTGKSQKEIWTRNNDSRYQYQMTLLRKEAIQNAGYSKVQHYSSH